MADIFVIVYDENRPSLVKYTSLNLFHRSTDEGQVLPTQPETNTNFIARFQPTILRPLPYYWRQDCEASFVTPETNVFFLAKFQPTVLRVWQPWHRSVDEQVLPIQSETNTAFIGKFQPTLFLSPLALRQAPATDIPSATIADTPVNFLARFQPTILRWPQPWHRAVDEQVLPQQPETITYFIAGFQPAQWPDFAPYHQVPAGDLPPVAVVDTPTNFIARFSSLSLRPYTYHIRQDTELSGPLPTQPETNVNFIGRLQPTPTYRVFPYSSRPTDEGSVTPSTAVFEWLIRARRRIRR